MSPPSESTSPPIRVALIGCGRMGLEHLKAIGGLTGSTVVAIADPAIDAAAVRSAAGREIHVFADCAKMLAESAPDVVHIVTPPATHARLALQALQAGCHLYVEKPFATSLSDARQILALAHERGLRVCAGHQCLFEAPALRAFAQLPDIGRVVHVASLFSFRMVRRNLTPIEQCKDILPHAIYPMLQQLRHGAVGRPAAVEIAGCHALPSGDLYALLAVGNATGIVQVTLSGRPVEQYQDIVGSNGCLRADYVTGSVVRIAGPGTGVGALFTPYCRATQSLGAANRLLIRALLGRVSSYAGLSELIRRFHASIREQTASPVAPDDILDTVDVCERLGFALDAADARSEAAALARLQAEVSALPEPATRATTLVTGGTGFLGRRIAAELRHAGIRTRVVARRIPLASLQIAGVEYATADIAEGIDRRLLEDVESIVHCAAETAGGMAAHERNSIVATRRIVEAASSAGIRRIIHVSSLAVLSPSRRRSRPVDEQTPVDADSLGRGPYAWGKAESEREVERLTTAAGIGLRIIRPGPLVDYGEFQPPGRLGRELGPIFVAVGGRRSALHVCDVGTAARVIRSYVQDFASAPRLLNLTEGPPPTRAELMARHLANRGDLRVWWFPATLLRLLSGPAWLLQRLFLRSRQPVDLYSAFAGGYYRTELAAEVIRKAGPAADAAR